MFGGDFNLRPYRKRCFYAIVPKIMKDDEVFSEGFIFYETRRFEALYGPIEEYIGRDRFLDIVKFTAIDDSEILLSEYETEIIRPTKGKLIRLESYES